MASNFCDFWPFFYHPQKFISYKISKIGPNSASICRTNWENCPFSIVKKLFIFYALINKLLLIQVDGCGKHFFLSHDTRDIKSFQDSTMSKTTANRWHISDTLRQWINKIFEIMESDSCGKKMYTKNCLDLDFTWKKVEHIYKFTCYFV